MGFVRIDVLLDVGVTLARDCATTVTVTSRQESVGISSGLTAERHDNTERGRVHKGNRKNVEKSSDSFCVCSVTDRENFAGTERLR